MKKLLLTLCLISAFTLSSNAQIDLKINPIGVLFNSPDIAGEYLVSENLGAELSIGLEYGNVAGSGLTGIELKKSGYRVRLSGKYYFNPDDGCDKFYAGLYLGPRSRKNTVEDLTSGQFDSGYKISAFGAGLLIGYKWVSDGGVVFEIGTGAGRAFGEKITYNDETNTGTVDGFGLDLVGTLAVGYRFGGK